MKDQRFGIKSLNKQGLKKTKSGWTQSFKQKVAARTCIFVWDRASQKEGGLVKFLSHTNHNFSLIMQLFRITNLE